MIKVCSIRTTVTFGLMVAAVGSSAAAAELRGTLSSLDSLHPAPAPPATGRRLFYWEEPNGAIDVRRPHAVTEMDLAVILTGDGVAESTQPVSLPVVGGRCRPGTIVVAPNAVLRIQNQDWVAHEFFAAAAGSTDAIAAVPAEATAPRSERQVQIPEAGTYEIRDRQQPLFRCWVIVGNGQGRVVTPNAEGAFRINPITDGQYTVKAYFEGRAVAEASTRISGDHDVTVPPLNVAGPAPAAPPAGAPAAAPGATAAPAGGAAAAPAAEADTGHHHRHRH